MKRILIADDHAIVRHGLRKVLESRPEWAICGEAANGREAVGLALALHPDIVILDISMPDLNGLEAARQIRLALPQTEVLILTMHESELLIQKTLAVGAKGYVLKSDAGDTLVSALEQLAQHRPFFATQTPGASGGAYLTPGDSAGEVFKDNGKLTPREREIVQLIAEGRTTKEIAEILHVTFKTADTHRTNILRKLQIHSVSELVRYAIRNQIIEP
jgi:DNA-binding NarL/FixJ family response regulator